MEKGKIMKNPILTQREYTEKLGESLTTFERRHDKWQRREEASEIDQNPWQTNDEHILNREATETRKLFYFSRFKKHIFVTHKIAANDQTHGRH